MSTVRTVEHDLTATQLRALTRNLWALSKVRFVVGGRVVRLAEIITSQESEAKGDGRTVPSAPPSITFILQEPAP